MFKFLDLFKKKSNPIPTIKATAQHKIDDKRQHEIFLTELEKLLVFSELFKDDYISKYKSLYKTYKAFTGKDHTLISKQPYFIESLIDQAKQFQKSDIRRYTKNIVLLANQRAYAKVTLNRFMQDNLFQEVTLIFPNNNLICQTVIDQKKKFHNKRVLISKAPIFPLITCIKCPRCHPCYHGIMYKPYIEIKGSII